MAIASESKNKMLQEIFGCAKPVIGVIHLLPLPGSARFGGRLEPIYLRAEQEAAALTSGGAAGIIIENFFDAPFCKNHVDAATACAMTVVVKRVMDMTQLPVGINVLRNDAHTALAIAAATGARFIRVNVFTGAMLTDQGIIEGEAQRLQLYRNQLQAQKTVKIFADVLVKHADALVANPDIKRLARDTVHRGLADAVIVSGRETGDAPVVADVQAVRDALPDTPIFIGSGIDKENISTLLKVADGAIVGSSLKRQGNINNPVDVERVRTLVSELAV